MAGSQDTVSESQNVGTGAERDWQTRLEVFSKSDFVRSFPYWFIPFSIMGLGVYGGIGYNTLISLTDYEGFNEGPDFSPGNLDLEMYVQAVNDPWVWTTSKNTFVLTSPTYSEKTKR